MNFEVLTQGFAFLLDAQGTIVKVLHDSFGVERADAGSAFTQLVDRQSMRKALSFLAALRAEGAAFDWELAVPVSGGMEILHVAGVVAQESLVVIGSKDRGEINDLYHGMIQINNEQMNQLRSAVKDKTEAARQRDERDDPVYDKLSRLNNELINLQRELSRKNVELSRLNDLKNQFIGMAAHDLRNPLASILTYSEFTIDELGDDIGAEYLEFLEIIRDSSNFMLELVNNLLDVSTIESGKLQLNLQIVDLPGLIEKNTSRNNALAQKKGIRLVFIQPDPPPPSLLLDGPKIEQVLNNLLSNAIKYSHPDTQVVIRLQQTEDSVILSVEDEGQGIPESEMSKLFRYFGRTSVQATGGERSTGLGLAIARNIVEGHEGRIWADSEVGKGSTFYVSLPLDSALVV